MVFWKREVILFGKARAFFEAGVTILQESRIGNRPQGGSRRPRPRTGRVNSSVLNSFIKADGSRERSEPWSESGGYGQLC